ncbi:hypothetical protein G7Y79_00028g061650 [Physcia stellaris]|nr:hypothetical protein G7Y79_00028g061650 [Physcia stellaris]
MFPGVASAPFSVVKLGPDLYTGADAYSGYLPTGNVTGFSMMHDSGRGGAPKYGTVSQLPVVGHVSNPLVDLSSPRASADQAQVGSYSTSLSSGVQIQLSATNHAGLFSYSFPTPSQSNIVVDVSHVLPSFRGQGLGQNYVRGNVTVSDDGHYEGSGTYNNGWNRASDWTIYFCGYFDEHATSKVFSGIGTMLSSYGSGNSASGTNRVGVVFTFNESNVTSRVGVSFISSSKACQFVDNEIPPGTELQDLIGQANSNWNSQVFLQSADQRDRYEYVTITLLFTLWHALDAIEPNRRESALGYDDLFTLWDLAMEYAANDFALHQVANGRKNYKDANKYLARSRNWRNHWNSDASPLDFDGFVVPRNADRSFVPQDPEACGGCYWGDAFYEATPWEYSFSPHHDIYTLIDYTGGPDDFVRRLDTIFQPNLNSKDADRFFASAARFASPYLFNFAGRQDLSVQRSRYIAKTYYSAQPDGLPGNSDAGAMQTWLLWNMIGLYPLTGQTTFLITSPWFSMNIDLGKDKTLNITSTGGNSDTAYYVQSLKVNGQNWDKSWLTWDDVFANGGTMEYVLGSSPSGWSTDGELPPSPAS